MIYVNGDSFTAGYPLEEIADKNYDWPNVLSKSIDRPVVNDARSGCSNYRIYRRTFDKIISQKYELYIIFLTKWERTEFGVTMTCDKPGRIHQYLPGNFDERFIKEFYINRFQPYLNYGNILRQIISLQTIAKKNKVPLIIMDTFSNNIVDDITLEWFKEQLTMFGFIDFMEDERIIKQFDALLMLRNAINWDDFISKKSYSRLVKNMPKLDSHPGIEAHGIIANIVYEYIQNKGYLKNGKTV